MGHQCGWKGGPKGGHSHRDTGEAPNGHRADPALVLQAGGGEHMVAHNTS